jgi:hypothetical protein
VRYCAKLVALRSGLKAQVHAVLAKAGILIPVSDLFGRERLVKVPLGSAYAQRVTSLLELIDVLDAHENRFVVMIAAQLHNHAGYRAIQELPGVGPTLERYSSPRWGTFTGSPVLPRCVRGPDRPLATTNSTWWCGADT